MCEAAAPPCPDRRRLFDDHAGLVQSVYGRHFGRSHTRSDRRRGERDDVFQEGYVGLWEAAALYDPGFGLCFAAFAAVRIRRRMSRAYRTRFLIRLPDGLTKPTYAVCPIRQAWHQPAAPSGGADPSAASFSPEVEAALARLPGEERRCLLLFALHGLSQWEIRREVGRSSGWVWRRIHGALRKLRESLSGSPARPGTSRHEAAIPEDEPTLAAVSPTFRQFVRVVAKLQLDAGPVPIDIRPAASFVGAPKAAASFAALGTTWGLLRRVTEADRKADAPRTYVVGIHRFAGLAAERPVLARWTGAVFRGEDVTATDAPGAEDAEVEPGAAALSGRPTFEEHANLVPHIYRRHYRTCPPALEDDLHQEGRIGLLRATELYDPTRGVTFASFAARHIRARMARALKERHLIHVPESGGVASPRTVSIAEPHEEPPARADAAPPDDDAPLSPRMAGALASLSERDRRAVTLWAVRGWTFEDVAREMGWPEKTAGAKVKAAAARLRAALGVDAGRPPHEAPVPDDAPPLRGASDGFRQFVRVVARMQLDAGAAPFPLKPRDAGRLLAAPMSVFPFVGRAVRTGLLLQRSPANDNKGTPATYAFPLHLFDTLKAEYPDLAAWAEALFSKANAPT